MSELCRSCYGDVAESEWFRDCVSGVWVLMWLVISVLCMSVDHRWGWVGRGRGGCGEVAAAVETAWREVG